MNDYDSIAEKLFKIIKGFGHHLELFTDSGEKTVDPLEARRIYIKGIHVMITLSEQNDNLLINLSKGNKLENIKPMLKSLRTLANRFIIGYTVKTFGKIIKPKDFMYQAMATVKENNTVKEGFSGWHGSPRKSINELDNSRLIIRHKANVDESKRGSRTRQIDKIFIENSSGERMLFPGRNLNAAKAMLRHIREGGDPKDEYGKNLCGLMEELDHLKTFQHYNRRDAYFESAQEVTEGITKRIDELRVALRQMTGPKGYQKHYERLGAKKKEDEQLNELKQNLATKYFTEEVAESLPFVTKIIENVMSQKEMKQTVLETAKTVIKLRDEDQLQLTSPISGDDPDNPTNQQFSDPAAKVSAYVTYISPKLQDDSLSNMLMRMSDIVFNEEIDPATISLAEKVVNALMGCCREPVHPKVESRKAIEDDSIKQITEAIMNY